MDSENLRFDKLFIDGSWTKPVDGVVVPSFDPADGRAWAEVAYAGEKDVDQAVAAAKRALRGPWSAFAPAKRAEVLRRIGRMFEEKAEEFAHYESTDTGMLLSDARKQVGALSQYWYYYAGLADKIEGKTIPIEDGVLAYTTRLPVGVVGAIVPWNAPLQLLVWKTAPALAAGCTVIIKSSEHTGVTAYMFAREIEKLGLPPGIINVICGEGAVSGRRLVEHRDVNKITFTGEHRTAQEIMRTGAETLKRLSFECGGKAPHIIFDDAPLEAALNAATSSAFALTGQSCALGSRVLVQRGIYERVVEEIARRSRAIRIGHPRHEKTQMGPQASQAQLDKTLRYVGIGKEEGARLVSGGERLDAGDLGKGFYVQPTIFADVKNSMQIAQNEIFGPVVSMIPFDTEEEAIAVANDVDYGLTAGLWSKDFSRAHRVASKLEAGTVWVNTYRYIRYCIPYGGVKLSGLGRENGVEAINSFLETRSTILNINANFADSYAN